MDRIISKRYSSDLFLMWKLFMRLTKSLCWTVIGFVLVRISLNCRCYDFINYFLKEESHSLLPSSQKLGSHSFFAPLYNASKKCYRPSSFLSPSKTWENLWFSNIFWGCRKGRDQNVKWNEKIMFQLLLVLLKTRAELPKVET